MSFPIGTWLRVVFNKHDRYRADTTLCVTISGPYIRHITSNCNSLRQKVIAIDESKHSRGWSSFIVLDDATDEITVCDSEQQTFLSFQYMDEILSINEN